MTRPHTAAASETGGDVAEHDHDSCEAVALSQDQPEDGVPEAIEPEPSGFETAEDESGRTGCSVLIVEDSPLHLKILTGAIERSLGWTPLPADGVEAAVSWLLRERPSLIVMDVMMPGLNGADLLTVLKTRPDWRSIPVVVSSGVSDTEHVNRLLAMGVRDYILKPFDPVLAVPRLRSVWESCSGAPAPPCSAQPAVEPDRVPIVLASSRVEVRDLVRSELASHYQIVPVGSGAEALVVAMEIRPWVVLVAPDIVEWGMAKTMRSLRALKTLARTPVVRLPHVEQDGGALIECLRRELNPPPFSLQREANVVSVILDESFTPSCLGALERTLGEQAEGAEQIAFEIPSHGVGWELAPALRAITQQLRHDDETENTVIRWSSVSRSRRGYGVL